MSFFKKLFGGSDSSGGSPKVASRETYKDFIIEASPMAEGGQYRLRAFIVENEAENARRATVIRADLFTSADQASEFAVMKAKQVIDEQGSAVFN
ncbi:MAG: HlyU family transcriptional regulator [Hyphomicrobiales bacterium]|jgi:hypothetical protein